MVAERAMASTSSQMAANIRVNGRQTCIMAMVLGLSVMDQFMKANGSMVKSRGRAS